MLMKQILLFLIAVQFPLMAIGALAPVEQKISSYISQQKKEELLLLEKLVNINSGTTNIAGVTKIGELLKPAFEALGFKTEWKMEPVTMHRAGTLVAKREGTSGKRLLLIGHLDTVFSKDDPFQTFKVKGMKATGPGVMDDKGGDVVILYALKGLFAANALDNTSITVVLTGDEEDSGKPTAISRIPLFEAASTSDIALDFECANSMDTASIARRGISGWELKVEGKTAHSSDIFEPSFGDGAGFELARILNRMREELYKEPYLSFNPGLMLAGTNIHYENAESKGSAFGKSNVIISEAMASGDLRYISNEQKTSIQNKIKAIVKRHLPKTDASITFWDGIPPMPPTKANEQLLKQYSNVSEDLGTGPIVPLSPKARGAGDISHIASKVEANLVGLGPFGTGAHSSEETLDIPSLEIQTKRAALLIYRLTHPD